MAIDETTGFNLSHRTSRERDAERTREPRPPRSHLPRVEFRLEERRQIRGLLSIVCAITVSWIARFLPAPLRRFLAAKGGDVSYRVIRGYRENVTENLRQVLGPATPERELDAVVRRLFRASGQNWIELLLIPHLSSKQIVAQVPLVSGNWSYLNDAYAAGKGVIIITGHLGAFDVVGQALHHRGYKLTSVTGRTMSRFLFDAVTFLRRSHEMLLVEASPSGIRRVIQALRRGEGAVFLVDRDFFNNGRPVRFFGRETTLSPGAVRLARDTGAMIVPIFGTRTSSGLGMIIEPPFEVEKTGDLVADVDRGLAQVVSVLERVIAARPDQWVMFQPVWPSAPDDQSSVPSGGSTGAPSGGAQPAPAADH